MSGQQLKDARLRMGLTQVELARRLGVSSQIISNYEREVAAIPKTTALAVDHLQLLAEAAQRRV